MIENIIMKLMLSFTMIIAGIFFIYIIFRNSKNKKIFYCSLICGELSSILGIIMTIVYFILLGYFHMFYIIGIMLLFLILYVCIITIQKHYGTIKYFINKKKILEKGTKEVGIIKRVIEERYYHRGGNTLPVYRLIVEVNNRKIKSIYFNEQKKYKEGQKIEVFNYKDNFYIIVD